MIKPFMDDDFMLHSPVARILYHDFAASQPLYDYHCHLSPADIATDRQFDNLAQIWLEGDHYKWRAMRIAGVEENLITGTASDYDKYLAWANTVPLTPGNPLFHWTHLELKRPFGISGKLLGPENAEAIWHDCNEKLREKSFSARGIMQQMNVHMVGTTDDPCDSLQYHRQIALDSSFDIEVAPSWRPDNVFKIEQAGFADYILQLSETTGLAIESMEDLRGALTLRLNHFAAHGCRAADHGIEQVRFAEIPEDRLLDKLLLKRLGGAELNELEIAQFSSAILVWLGQQYAQRGWVMQYHIGAIRDANTMMKHKVGTNSGFDSIGDSSYAVPLARLLDTINEDNKLPKTILYCLNPRDFAMLATMAGNFCGGSIAGKVQMGSGWWYNDQKDGMLQQLEQLSQMSLLSQFVGMLTDSRSFLSYTRHEYFRRILCNKIGQLVTEGELPWDQPWLGKMVMDISFWNAKRYFALPNEHVNSVFPQ